MFLISRFMSHHNYNWWTLHGITVPSRKRVKTSNNHKSSLKYLFCHAFRYLRKLQNFLTYQDNLILGNDEKMNSEWVSGLFVDHIVVLIGDFIYIYIVMFRTISINHFQNVNSSLSVSDILKPPPYNNRGEECCT